MIEALARAAVARMIERLGAAAADELPDDVRIEIDGDRAALIGPSVRLRALTDARIAGIAQFAARRR